MADQGYFAKLFNEATEGFEAMLEEVEKERPPVSPLACRAGCNHCCYQPEITVTAIEIFHIVDRLTEHWQPAEIKTLEKTLAGAKDGTASWPLSPCPLLKDERCSIYEVRPLICRGCNSYSISDCEKAVQDKDAHQKVRYYQPQVQAAHLMVGIIEKSSHEAKLEPLLDDLRPALLTALTQPDARKRWLAGEPIFKNAKHERRLSES